MKASTSTILWKNRGLWTVYKVRYCLLQIVTAKVRYGLLQITIGMITKCDGFVTNRDGYYKVGMFISNCDSTLWRLQQFSKWGWMNVEPDNPPQSRLRCGKSIVFRKGLFLWLLFLIWELLTSLNFEVIFVINYRHFRLTVINEIQLVVYYQCCVLIGWATTGLYVIAH